MHCDIYSWFSSATKIDVPNVIAEISQKFQLSP